MLYANKILHISPRAWFVGWSGLVGTIRYKHVDDFDVILRSELGWFTVGVRL